MIEPTIRAFDADLQDLARKIAEMGRRDDEQIAGAMEAVVTRDNALAERVVAADDPIDALQREIEEKAITTIARRQPMAVDLREIVAALRISNDLERVGDLAENIAKRVPIGGRGQHQRGHAAAAAHGRARAGAIDAVLDSYERRDAAEALEVWRKD